MITALVILIPICIVTMIGEWVMSLPEKMETRRYAHFLKIKCKRDYGW